MLYTGFLLGLLSSFHCFGMCGAIAWAIHSNVSSSWLGKIAYNTGRISTYALMGLVLGFFAENLPFAQMQQSLSILSGVLIILFVIFSRNSQFQSFSFAPVVRLVGLVKKNLGLLLQKRSSQTLFAIGLLNGLLPCGLVYLALAGALGMSNSLEAAFYMGLFGLGTLPMMLAVGFGSQYLGEKARNFLNKSIPYVAVTIAILFIIRGLNLGIPYLSPKINHESHKPNMECCD